MSAAAGTSTNSGDDTASRRARATAHPDRCAQCGTALAEDQEWCVECGSSRTMIYSAPDWRIPVIIVSLVIVVAVVGFVIAIMRLSHTNNASAAQPTPSAIIVRTRAATTTPHTTVIAGWPVGLSGWTVVLNRYTTEAPALARAHQVATHGLAVGMFDSTEHPRMRPGYWIVFSGRYPDRREAQAATSHLVSEGYASAVARQVAQPGGL